MTWIIVLDDSPELSSAPLRPQIIYAALWIHCGRPVRFIGLSYDVRISMERFGRTVHPPWFHLVVIQTQTCRFYNLCFPVKDFEVRNTRKIAI